jgi:ATP-dependent helicase/nuclease subunit B
MDKTGLPEFNGFIFDRLGNGARAALESFRDRIYSVTQLESYGKCPFQFFAGKVLRLNVPREFEAGLSPLERGDILHEILFDFYTQRRERNLPPLHQVDEPQFHEAVNHLLAIARAKLEALDLSDAFWEVDKELLLGSGMRTGVLREFLLREKERELDTSPAWFEVAFGPSTGSRRNSDNRLRMEQPLVAGSVRLRGKIDRIDASKDVFTVIDYKSGDSIAKRKEIELGVSLQLPLYLYAVEHILAEQERRPLSGVAGIYYTLKSPVKDRLGIGNREFVGKAFDAQARNPQLLENGSALRSVIARAVAFVNEYVDSIARGNFPVAPKVPEQTCAYCDFRTICRIQLQGATQSGS